MEKIEEVFNFLDNHPYMTVLAVIGGAIGFILDTNNVTISISTNKKEV